MLRSIQTCGLSDHKVQIMNLDYSITKPSSRERALYVRSFQNCQWDELFYVLWNVLWEVMYSFEDINDQWAFFHTILEECLHIFVPLRKVYSRKSKRPTPWFLTDISNLIKLKNKAKKRADRSKAESDQAVYKNYRNKLKHVVRQAKLDYLQTSFAQSKSHSTFAAELWFRINGVLN